MGASVVEAVAGTRAWAKWKIEHLCVYCGTWSGGHVRVTSWLEERALRLFESRQGTSAATWQSN